MLSLAATALLGGVVYVCPQIVRILQVKTLTRQCSRKSSLALTYDDGPGATLTPRLLDLLKAYEAKATFFPLGFRANLNPQILDRMAEEGHQVGCHGYRHLHAWKCWPWRVAKNVGTGYDVLSKWVPRDGAFRPPWGKLTLPIWLALRRRHASIAWWTIDARDTRRPLPDPQVIVDAVSASHGGVVLMHDFDRGSDQSRYVLKTTEMLLRQANRGGLRLCHIRECTK